LKQHDKIDKFTSRWLAKYRQAGRTIYCRDRCAGCCHLAVHATWPEAVAVTGHLSAQQSRQLAEYVERLQDALPELTDLKSYLKRHRLALGPCPFLDATGSCSIYPVRPLACRALLSTRSAAWCTVDFSALDQWDKQAYESSLDRQVVAWPTHYVAATQDIAKELERDLLASMRRRAGWALSGNFAVMVWLAVNNHLNGPEHKTTEQLRALLETYRLDNRLLLNFSVSSQELGADVPQQNTD